MHFHAYVGESDGAFRDVGGENEMGDSGRWGIEGIQLVFEGDHGVKHEDAQATTPARRRHIAFEVDHQIEHVVDRRSEKKEDEKWGGNPCHDDNPEN